MYFKTEKEAITWLSSVGIPHIQVVQDVDSFLICDICEKLYQDFEPNDAVDYMNEWDTWSWPSLTNTPHLKEWVDMHSHNPSKSHSKR